MGGNLDYPEYFTLKDSAPLQEMRTDDFISNT